MSAAPIHIEADPGDWDAPLTVVVMVCGYSCIVLDNGDTVPEDADFISPRYGWKATCRACLAAVDEPEKKREAVA